MTDLYIAGGSGVWALTAFKYLVCISGDGKTAAALSYVGVTGQSTTLYTTSVTPTFTLIQKNVPNTYAVAAGVNSMSSLSMSYDGNTLCLSRLGNGSGPSQINMRVYDPGTTTWSNFTFPSGSYGFGNFGWDATRINEAGTKIYARISDRMMIFNWNGVALTNANVNIGSGMAHREIMMSRNSQYLISSNTTSSIKVYQDTGGDTWVQRGVDLVLPTPPIGVTFTRYAISGTVSDDGNHVVLTVSNGKGNNFQGFAYYTWDGAAYVFQSVTNVLDFITDGSIVNYDSVQGCAKIRMSNDSTRITIGDDFTPAGDPSSNKLSNSFVYFERSGVSWSARDSFNAHSFTPLAYNIDANPEFSSFVVAGTLGVKFGMALFVRQPPTAVNDSFGTINSNIARALNVKTNDDMKNNSGAVLSIVSNGGLSLTTDSVLGTVTVAQGTPIGSYSFTYRWTTASGYVGNTATSTLQVVSGAPTIVNDSFGNYVHGVGASFNPVLNDDLKDATLTSFSITNYNGANPSDFSVNTSTGLVSLLATAPIGNYSLTYSITTSAGTTSGGIITFSVVPGPPTAIIDNFGNYIRGGNYSFNPVLNDDLDGGTLTNFTITNYNGANLNDFSVNSSTGLINLLSTAAKGNYSLNYSITTTGGTDTGGMITFTIVSAAPVIFDDDFGTYLSGNSYSFNPILNDDLDGETLTLFEITNYNGANPSDFSVNSSTGLVNLLSTAPVGSYNLTYSITTPTGTATGGNIVFTIVSSYTPIVLAEVNAASTYLTSTTVDVVTPSDLGGRMLPDVDVIVVNDGGTGAFIVGKQIIIPSGLPPGNYRIEYDFVDNATDGLPTGNTQFVNFTVVLYTSADSINFGIIPGFETQAVFENRIVVSRRTTRCLFKLYLQAVIRCIENGVFY